MSYKLVNNCKRLFKKIENKPKIKYMSSFVDKLEDESKMSLNNSSSKISNEKDNNIVYLNELINKQYSKEIEDKLSDKNLNQQFLKCSSCQKMKTKIKNIIKNDYNDNILLEKRVEELLSIAIPAGTKGVIRGNFFNSIVKDELLSIQKIYNQLNISFESKIEECDEIADFIIKYNNKYIIGMNQVDLWSGGQQINRASKYLKNSKNSDTRKLLCVVAYKYIFKNSHTKKSKSFNLVKNGLENNTLCYVNNLKNIIINFFQL
jgi:hypothetical protein